MNTIIKDLGALEQHVAALDKAAGKVSSEKMTEGVSILVRMAGQVQDQSDNAAYNGLGASVTEPAPIPDTVSDTGEVSSKTGGGTKLSYDVYKANAVTAEQILNQMDAVNTKIDEIVTAGKKGFKADAARADIHAVTAKVAGITADVDLTVPWVADDLQRLAARASHLHSLFFPQA